MRQISTSWSPWRRPRRLAVALALAAFLPAGSLVAQEDLRWSVTVSGAWWSPAGGETAVERPGPAGDAERTVLRLDEDGTGFGATLEWRATPRFGCELGVMIVDLDADFRVEADGPALAERDTLGVESVFLGADWHPAPRAAVDVSLGAFVAQTMFDDVIFLAGTGRPEKRTFDDDHGFGAKLGLEWPAARDRRWFVAADARYLLTLLEGEIAGADMDLDPLIVTAGVGLRF